MQHVLFRLLQPWQSEREKSGSIRTILIDLSKAYDCLPHDFFIAKLEVYGVNEKEISLK